MESTSYDVAIVGGGPGGSTTAALLRKYAPDRRVLVLEKEIFPRDHVGESQLPPIGAILDEMGCWDAVEAEGFPIKIGATYRWGQDPELWDFEFLSLDEFRDEPRPAPYEGQRRRTALQVDRARYDQILLDHAERLGAEVRQGSRVAKVHVAGGAVEALELSTGTRVEARYFVDASGGPGVIRSALKVPIDCPTQLQNVALWDYWDNAEWAVEIGVGGTRVQVMSLPFGWLWFIPLGPTRTSIGLVCPAAYYQRHRGSPEELYAGAIASEPRIAALVAGGRRRGKLETTKDWSFLAERAAGSNWLLVGESVGFADPILAAGMTLTHSGAREAAYTLIALLSGEHDPAWLLRHYERNQRARIRQHIRFADFWYAANGQLTDLQEHCSEIAAEAGLTLDAKAAWAWLAQGGFANDSLGQSGIGGVDLAAVKQIAQRFTTQAAEWRASSFNVLELDLAGAEREAVPLYADGKIREVPAYHRDGKRLALVNMFALVAKGLERTQDVVTLVDMMRNTIARQLGAERVEVGLHHALQALEVMLSEGWVRGRLDPSRPRLVLETPDEGPIIHRNRPGR